MMKAGILIPLIVALSLPVQAQPASNSIPTATFAFAAPGSVWSLTVVGLKGESLGTITLELSSESANTCMSGEWKKARLIQSSFRSPAKRYETKGYFPTYETDGQVLTIQLNPPGLCDAYLFLKGKFAEREGKGEYVSFGLGWASPLGTFTAKRLKR